MPAASKIWADLRLSSPEFSSIRSDSINLQDLLDADFGLRGETNVPRAEIAFVSPSIRWAAGVWKTLVVHERRE
ncbi:MAG: hypothetical protein AB2811_03885, partial [Candidatus Sedimenticola endophacoides]